MRSMEHFTVYNIVMQLSTVGSTTVRYLKSKTHDRVNAHYVGHHCSFYKEQRLTFWDVLLLHYTQCYYYELVR